MARRYRRPRGERRRFQRVPVSVPATVQVSGDVIFATLRDLSRSGASLELSDSPAVPPGARVQLAGAVLPAWDATLVEADGPYWRLAFEPALPAKELVGVARALAG